MKVIKIIKVMKQKNYFFSFFFFFFLFSFLYIYTQVIGIIENIPIWFAYVPWYNFIFFIIFSLLFGITVSFQIYQWRQPKICSNVKRVNVKGVGSTSSATILGLFVAQCPACASLGVLVLPVSVVGIFTQYGMLFNIVSIGLLLFTIYHLGGFKK